MSGYELVYGACDRRKGLTFGREPALAMVLLQVRVVKGHHSRAAEVPWATAMGRR